jgi:hypothetical protein
VIWQMDHPNVVEWIINAGDRGGGFVSTLAKAAMRADAVNYPLLRPSLLLFVDKYPEYNRRPEETHGKANPHPDQA